MMNYEKMITDVLNDPEVKQNQRLHTLFSKSLSRYLKNHDRTEIAYLVNDISYYLILNNYIAPKIVLDFATKTQKELHRLRGLGSALDMLATSILGFVIKEKVK
ncbi:bacteriocin immunity protein [Streptococcus sp. sy018]|uniref:bacteriocin immunity protein n=1 Tax=Streptococcus sp. sy018 TaxID=2600147 RepID=UPI0011B7B0E5|nr:bacteriocin immunity protein [Streptococcus sp. sy018]TWS94795.1 bacteriocin immunity protein [Streptococcus sp. sy018]